MRAATAARSDRGTVLVTGATGFVGRALVADLAAKGWRVIAAARHPEATAWPAGIESRRLPDLGRPVDWTPLLTGVTHVVHGAGIAHASAAIPEATYRSVNADAAVALAEAMRKAGLSRLVFLSSSRAQSGPTATAILREDAPAQPTDAYGRAKLAAETGIERTLAGTGTGYVLLRPVLVYGSGVKGNMQALMRLARLPLPLPVAGLTGRRSILSVGNLATAVHHALVADACRDRTFLVADPEPLSVPEIIAALRAGVGRPPGLFRVPATIIAALARMAGRADALDRLTGDLVADPSALRATGWSPIEQSASALAATARSAHEASKG